MLDYFRPQAVAAWVAGSVARGGMDEESDLDLGICFSDDAAREEAWARRWDWDIAPWFHRFDADHVKPYFVIYLFEPATQPAVRDSGTGEGVRGNREVPTTKRIHAVKTDLPLHTLDDLPAPAGGPYVLAWDETGRLGQWAATAVPPRREVDWSAAVHEEERLWAWLVYSLQHVRRGEYYSVAGDFWYLRDIVEQWQARLAGLPEFTIRRAEQLVDTSELAGLFPRPERGELRRALLDLIHLHERQRTGLDLPWRTTAEARARIKRWVEEL